MDDGRVTQAATRLLNDAGIGTPPVPVDRLARRLGAQLRFEPSRGDLAGLLFRDREQIILGVNALLPRTRQRFTMAHELGHLLLHPGDGLHIDRDFRSRRKAERTRAVQPVDIRDLTLEALTPALTLDVEAMLRSAPGNLVAMHAGREARVSGYFTSEPGTVTATLPIGGDSAAANAREQEANSFAAELLLPAATLRADIEGDLDYEEDDRVRRLAERYQVSLQLLLRRLAALGLFAPSR
jgi:predicted transcriptional regulator